MAKDLVEQFFENSKFERLYAITKQGFNPQRSIQTPDDVTQALMYIVQMLQSVANSISTEQLQCDLDNYLPGTRLQEAEKIDIDLINKNLTLINTRLNEFLKKNPYQIVNGIDTIIEYAQKYANDISKEQEQILSSNTKRAISVFKTILNVFNRLINTIDKHNQTLDKNYKIHTPIQIN